MSRPLLAGLLLLTMASLAANRLRPLRPDYQKRAQEAPWTWSESQASLEYSITRHLQAYGGNAAASGEPTYSLNPFTLRIKVKGQEAQAWQGHAYTVFARWYGTLFVADYHAMASGCRVLAIDLRTGELLWKANLRGLGPIGHSKYRNRVNIETDGRVVTVRGLESAGRYIEFLSCETGETVGHKKYPRE
jgi:hypothetical protein